jgi:hypothetical protein
MINFFDFISGLLLTLYREDRHFFFHLPGDDHHFGYKQKFLRETLFPCTIRFKVLAKTNLLSIKVFGPLGCVLSASPLARLERAILDEVKHHSCVKWVCQCKLPSSLQLAGFQDYLKENDYFNS